MQNLNSGQNFSNFKIGRVETIPNLRCTLTTARHVPSGAQVVHIGNDDPENVFCLSFNTPPPNSSGITHILEHCALCGSRNFPVKDPFFAMIRRSLNTFMNALTGCDFTCYPAASQVPEDFYNLLTVYQDAVFNPLLSQTSFQQEGIRLERTSDETLRYAGIVFNEMKGVFSLPEARLSYLLLKDLFPNTPYHFESGGHPEEIPNLTLDQLRDYHARHYHPSRCHFYFYGNIPLEDHLEFLETTSLKGVTAEADLPSTRPPVRFLRPHKRQGSYPCPEGNREEPLFGMGWWTCDIGQRQTLWRSLLLEELLMGSDAAPLRRALIEEGHCSQVESALQSDLPYVPFFLILKGCKATTEAATAQAIDRILAGIADNGFTPEQIAGAVHRLKLQHLEIDPGRYPYGLGLFWRLAPAWQNGQDPGQALKVEDQLRELQDLCQNPGILRDELKRQLIDNRHRAEVYLTPDAGLAQLERERESQKLTDLRAALDAEALADIDRQSQELTQAQSRVDDLSILPSTPIAKISPKPTQIELIADAATSKRVIHSDAFTNGFAYFDCFFRLPDLSEGELAHASQLMTRAGLYRLLALFWPRVGAAGQSHLERAALIAANSGGMAAQIADFADAKTGEIAYYLQLRISGLEEKVPVMCSLMNEAIRSAHFGDADRLRELLAQHVVELQHRVASDALAYATLAASEAISAAARGYTSWRGVPYYRSVNALWQRCQQQSSSVISNLCDPLLEVFQALAAPEYLVVTCEPALRERLCRERHFGLADLLATPHTTSTPTLKISAANRSPGSVRQRGLAISSQVAANALSLPAARFADPEFPILQLIAQLLHHQTLHSEIRERGGAYTSGAQLRPEWATLTLYSARDPQILGTWKTFEFALKRLSERGCSANELDEAKRLVFQRLDAPIAPGERGLVAFARQQRGQTLEVRSWQRERLLRAQPADIQRLCQEHLMPNLAEAGFASAASADHLKSQVPELPVESL